MYLYAQVADVWMDGVTMWVSNKQSNGCHGIVVGMSTLRELLRAVPLAGRSLRWCRAAMGGGGECEYDRERPRSRQSSLCDESAQSDTHTHTLSLSFSLSLSLSLSLKCMIRQVESTFAGRSIGLDCSVEDPYVQDEQL